MQTKSFKATDYRKVKDRLHFFHKREEDLALCLQYSKKVKHEMEKLIKLAKTKCT
uniref:Uncharacterized protein n=1 Tax=Setaria italica TaxID=4555 RepID=K3XTG7_SETIT